MIVCIFVAIYSVEKRCMSRNELNQNAAQVVAVIGCGDAYDGLVVYCICEGQLCNRDTIAIQLQKDAKYIRYVMISSEIFCSEQLFGFNSCDFESMVNFLHTK